jgi:hypothetical protein
MVTPASAALPEVTEPDMLNVAAWEPLPLLLPPQDETSNPTLAMTVKAIRELQPANFLRKFFIVVSPLYS